MRDTVTTSWRRLSDQPLKGSDFRSACGGQAAPMKLGGAPQLQNWENEGGQSALFSGAVRILIVDHDIESATSLELMLHASGYSDTRVAYSGHAALAIAAEFQPSVVLLELRLLDMSSDEVARLLRERAQSHDLRLFALTSSHEDASHEIARAAGFERVLRKPVAPLDLSGSLQVDENRALTPSES